jgi:hypothetical protein
MDFSEFETARGGIWRICAVPWSVLAGRGHQHRRPGSCNGCLTLSPQVSHCTSTYPR